MNQGHTDNLNGGLEAHTPDIIDYGPQKREREGEGEGYRREDTESTKLRDLLDVGQGEAKRRDGDEMLSSASGALKVLSAKNIWPIRGLTLDCAGESLGSLLKI